MRVFYPPDEFEDCTFHPNFAEPILPPPGLIGSGLDHALRIDVKHHTNIWIPNGQIRSDPDSGSWEKTPDGGIRFTFHP